MFKSSALSINVLFAFAISMQEINEALFLKTNFLSYALSFGPVTVILPLTKM